MTSTEMKHAISQRWRELGYESEGAWLHDILRVAIYGSEQVANDEAQRIRSLFGNSTVTVPQE